ncbi:chemotaxis protein CheW [Amphritea sp. HPY]|uniref:chemotaxis protein CheW n=1 Tax=Amphritea sp. HPY TaxID=3421652 RepID=UPI003D7EA0EF
MSIDDATHYLQQIQAIAQAAQQGESSSREQDSQEIFRQWATFGVAGELYGIDVMQVKEVLRYTEITPVPGAAPGILGIINLRGNVVTVVSTRSLFKLPPNEIDTSTRIVVVEFDDQEVLGLLVDGVDEVLNLPQSEIDRAPGLMRDDATRQFVQGVCYRDEQLIILMDLDKMLIDFRS